MNGDNSLFDLIFPQMNPAVAESTGVAHDKINSLLSQQGETTQPSQFPTGSIYQTPEDKRNIIQKLADEFYESGPIGSVAAAAADILPGIPFVDIIDPPPQLSDPQMQKSRNLLSVLGIPLSMSQVPKAVGRVATNIKAPFRYSVEDIRRNVMYGGGKGRESYWDEPSKVKRIAGALGRTIKSITEDKPLYSPESIAPLLQIPPKHIKKQGMHRKRTIDRAKAMIDAREFLYRKIFGLKPRKGTKIFKENKDGTLSFNPKSKRGKVLIDEIAGWAKTPINLDHPPIAQHSVMGGFKRDIGKKSIKYEDVWDFKMNPGEWEKVLKANLYLPGPAKYYPFAPQRQALGQAGLRTLVDMMIKPTVIKGTIRY